MEFLGGLIVGFLFGIVILTVLLILMAVIKDDE